MGSELEGCQKSLLRFFSLQPFSINSAQTSLLKRVKLKPQFWKLQNSYINAQPSLPAAVRCVQFELGCCIDKYIIYALTKKTEVSI